MPFVKGKSGNPSGATQHKKKLLAELLLKDVAKAIEVLRDALSDPDKDTWAAKEILDRVYGKAPQAVELSGPEGGSISIVVNGKELPK